MTILLNRRLHERIKVGKDITVEVVAIHGNRVQLGIEAPPELTVLRSELVGRRPEGEKR